MMKSYDVLVVDDSIFMRKIISDFISEDASFRVVATAKNGREAIELVKKLKPHVVTMDIEMPEMNGIDLLRMLPNPTITVFTTAFRDYAFEGFELGVIDFLLKPISFPRFRVALEKINDFLSLKGEQTDVEISTGEPEFIFVKSGVQKIKLFLADVTYIQGLKDYAIIHAGTGKIVVKGSVKSMQQLFPAPQFIRVHKSFIVASEKIIRIAKNRIVIGEHQIPIGRNYKAQLERAISGS